MTYKLIIFVCLLTSEVSLAQECSGDPPVSSSCPENIPTSDWESELIVDVIGGISANVSWRPNFFVTNTFVQDNYVIFWRVRAPMEDPPNEWTIEPATSAQFNGTTDRFSQTIFGLTPDRPHEVVVCLSEVSNLSLSDPPPPNCGYCIACFSTRDGTIELLSAIVEIFSTGFVVYRCEVSSYVPVTVTWTAEMDENRETLVQSTNSSNFLITVVEDPLRDPPFTSTSLEYDPTNVNFDRPDCFIENSLDSAKVRNPEFDELIISDSTVTPSEGGGGNEENQINLISATVTFEVGGDVSYTCVATSGNSLPSFSWEVHEFGSRVTLIQDPESLYQISDDVVDTLDPPQAISTLAYNPLEVDFIEPECIASNGINALRVRNDEFSEEADLTAPVTIEVWAIVLLALLIPAGVLVTVIVLIVTIKCCKKHQRGKANLMTAIHPQHLKEVKRSGNDYTNQPQLEKGQRGEDSSMLYGTLETTLPKKMIVSNSDIKVSTVIGQGEFGVVYKGTLTRNNNRELVAVKTLKGIFTTASDIQSITEEILILQQFNHPNVMSLIGVCLGADKVGGGPSIILPFMSKGSLLNFIRKEADRLRPSKDADVTQIGAVEKSLVQICLQVARGMEYLAGQRFVHRDLAARNCMIDQNDEIKVGDFGLTEDIYAKNYFRQTSSDGVKLPVKWMAPESLKVGVFSEKSDVWAYGVTCWEVFSCGEIPYPGIHPQQVLNLLEDGQRLGKPRNPACSDQMYSILISCWRSNPDNRKNFTELCDMVEDHLNSMSDYLDLNVIANTLFTEPSVEATYMMADDSWVYGESVKRDTSSIGEVPQMDEGGYLDDSTSRDRCQYENAPMDAMSVEL